MNTDDIDFIALGRKLDELKEENRLRSNVLEVIGKLIDSFAIPRAIVDILIDIGIINESDVSVGYIHAPYIPLLKTKTNPITNPRAGIMLRYASNSMYGHINLSGVNGSSAETYHIID